MPSETNSTPGQLPIYDVLGTHYPIINVNQGLLAPYITKFKRAIAPINPFATQQISSQDRVAFGPRYGNQFYFGDAYPDGTFFSRSQSTHYDPLGEMNRKIASFQQGKYGPGSDLKPAIKMEPVPRGCARTIDNYTRCLIVNGQEKCLQEQNDIVDICPNWVLHSFKEKKKQLAKIIGIKLNNYRSAMEVSPYNEGRDVADAANKTWVDGTRKYLRPDTIWADERYSKITQADINEARERIRKRNEGKHVEEHHLKENEHYDWEHVKYKETNVPLYP